MIDFKKTDQDLNKPGKEPCLIDIPQKRFLMVQGEGNPNTSPAYKEAVELLYSMSFTIKMSSKKSMAPEGYYDYVVGPLEGLWRFEGEDDFSGEIISRKNEFKWVSMIRQPNFVNENVVEFFKEQLVKKKPELDLSKMEFKVYAEGLTVCPDSSHRII